MEWEGRSTRSTEREREENEVMILNLNNLLISLHIHILHAWWPPATFLAITHRGNDIKANAGGDYGATAICSYLARAAAGRRDGWAHARQDDVFVVVKNSNDFISPRNGAEPSRGEAMGDGRGVGGDGGGSSDDGQT